MFFDKESYIVPIRGGKGSINTKKMRGMVEHFIVRPKSKDTVWDLLVVDKEGDELIEIYNHDGRLDDKSGLPIGKDAQEKVTLIFSNVSRNEPIKVIFKVKELE